MPSSFPFSTSPRSPGELRPFLETIEVTPRFEEYLPAIDRTPRHTTAFLFDLNARLTREIQHIILMEPGVQTPERLESRRGSCRDSPWLLVQLLRRLGLLGRFVSGYLIQLKADVAALDGFSGPAADFTDLHAWAGVYLPGAGWVGLDPTSGLFAGEGHVPLAATPEPASAAPVTGLVSPCEVEFDHQISVLRIHADPLVTKPYSEE